MLCNQAFFRDCGATFDTAFSLSGSFIAALSLAALSLAVLRLATSNLAAMRDYERQDLRRPVKFQDWGAHWHGFHSDTVRDQAPVIFRARDVPGAPHDQKGWVLLVLQIDNNKNCNVDRRDSLEPSSICFFVSRYGLRYRHYMFYYCSYCSHAWLSAFLVCARLTLISS